MKPDSIIRVDDIVTVLQPLEFIRCGYPLTKTDLLSDIRMKRAYTMDLLKQLGICCQVSRGVDGFTSIEPSNPKGLKRLEDQLAFMLLHARRFGGHERRIYEKPTSRLEVARTYRVVAITFCKTGTYFGNNHAGSGDYYPAMLKNQQTHKILTLNTNSHLLGDVRIQARHVLKVGL